MRARIIQQVLNLKDSQLDELYANMILDNQQARVETLIQLWDQVADYNGSKIVHLAKLIYRHPGFSGTIKECTTLAKGFGYLMQEGYANLYYRHVENGKRYHVFGVDENFRLSYDYGECILDGAFYDKADHIVYIDDRIYYWVKEVEDA
jgi:hypothetical protein